MLFLISICIIAFVVSDVVPDKWRNVSSVQLPRIESRLFKSRTSQGKYIISPNNNKKTSDIMVPFLPPSKEIVRPPMIKKPCPPGQRRDSFSGQCKDIVVSFLLIFYR